MTSSAQGRDAPDCASCHGTHDILPSDDPGSSSHRSRVAGTCAACHGQEVLPRNGFVRFAEVVDAYARSVHGQSASAGSSEAAICTDCHGGHELRGSFDSAAPIHPRNVAHTCGRCHAAIAAQYSASIHGRALDAGVTDSPTCTNCHGEHLILSKDGPEARTHASNLASATCGECHDDPRIAAKYGLSGDVVSSYSDSYHGWATRRDWDRAATCVKCHTAHEVLPASDPSSTIHADRVAQTCGACHDGADASFAASYTHEIASITANPVNRWIRAFYLVLIAAVVGGMLLHNLVIINYYLVERRRALAREEQVQRLDRSQIAQHMTLALSFMALVITGFALRFPDAWWVQGLTAMGMSEPVRADLHRFFGIVLVVLSLVHVHYVLLTRRGRRQLEAMLPGRSEHREILANLSFHTWFSRQRPRFGRYDYTQKAEYWAVVWGTGLMALTGSILWFPERLAHLLPSWAIPASQTIHYYEAWLATLAILVWHFFFVMFHPDVYPVSWTWLNGKMPRREARERHPGWYDRELAPQPVRKPESAD